MSENDNSFPTEIKFFSNKKIVDISCGFNYSFVLLSKIFIIIQGNGDLYGFGNNKEPEFLFKVENNSKIISGESHTFILTSI